jgi:hypothetical protein
MGINLEDVIQIFHFFFDLQKDIQGSPVYGHAFRLQAHINETSDYGSSNINNNNGTNEAVFQTLDTAEKMEFLTEQYKET